MRLMKKRASLPLTFLLASLAFAMPTAYLPFGPWTRASNEPILSPQGATRDSPDTFSPTPLLHNARIVMLFRAQAPSRPSAPHPPETPDAPPPPPPPAPPL